MLQFNQSEVTNKNAVYLDTVNTGSGYYDSLRIAYSQSYDNSNGTFTVTAESLPTAYRNWLTITNAGVGVPSYTGQYDIELYTTEEAQATWMDASSTWTSTTDVWSNVPGGINLVDLLYSDRAYIVGNNDSSITQYSSPNENGTYTTYNG